MAKYTVNYASGMMMVNLELEDAIRIAIKNKAEGIKMEQNDFIVIEIDGTDKMIDTRKIAAVKANFVMTIIYMIDGTILYTRDKVTALGSRWIKL